MFTKYPEVFIEVQKKMESNHYVGEKNIEKIISQTIFEVLSYLEDNKK